MVPTDPEPSITIVTSTATLPGFVSGWHSTPFLVSFSLIFLVFSAVLLFASFDFFSSALAFFSFLAALSATSFFFAAFSFLMMLSRCL